MNKFRIIYLMLCAFPFAANAQDSIKSREVLMLNSEINRLVGVNKNLRLELDSIKKMPIKMPSGFYLRLESSYPIKNPFMYKIVPSNLEGKRVYTVQSFKNSKDAKQLTKAIRAFNLIDYKVVYIGDYYSLAQSPLSYSNTMYIED
jgi:hypothetical protein